MKRHLLVLLGGGLLAAGTRAEADEANPWSVSAPLLRPGATGTFDEVAVKDPTLVLDGGRWHVFYTAKPRVGAKDLKTGLGYVAAARLEDLGSASRVEMRPILGDAMIAPQVFYFRPQRLWYLVGHVRDEKTRRLEPVYTTNPEIGNVQGWSKLRRMETDRQDRARVWIDFWVICDETKAHLFYSDHTDALYRMECPIGEFPHGLAQSREQLALRASGQMPGKGAWNFHEAAHIYRVKTTGQYLALLEGGYSHPVRKNQLNARDARDRFMFAMVADRLEGPWRRFERADNIFLGEANALRGGPGATRYTQVSHPEILRAGNDERLEVADVNFTILFQGFDGTKQPDTYDYDALPWELALMRRQTN